MERILPKEMRFEEIPFGGINDMENLVQNYIEQANCATIERETSADLFKLGMEALNKLDIKQHVIIYLYHVAGMTDMTIANFFKTSRLKIHRSRRATYDKLREISGEPNKLIYK